MGFSTALSGLKAAQTTLAVTGNNIANSQTAGFKESRAQFGDVYTASLGSAGKMAVGTGVRVSSVAQQFKQGNIEATGNALDLAISGDGFFAMGDLIDPIDPNKPLEATSFTRNGAFHINNKGNIVDDSGRYLLGFRPTGTTVAEGFDVGVKLPLRIDTDQGAPTATTAVDMKLNLNGASNAAATPFSFTTSSAPFIPDPKTYTHTTSITTYDAMGNAHIVSSYFCKTDVPNEWNVYSFMDGRSIEPGVQEDPYVVPPIAAAGAVVLPEGTITQAPSRVVFDDKGALVRVSPVRTALDTARSEEATSRIQLQIATAKTVTDLDKIDNAAITVERSASALLTALKSQRNTLEAADKVANAATIAALNTAIDSIAQEYGGADSTGTVLQGPQLGTNGSFATSGDLQSDIKQNFTNYYNQADGTWNDHPYKLDSFNANVIPLITEVQDLNGTPVDLSKQFSSIGSALNALKRAQADLEAAADAAVLSHANVGTPSNNPANPTTATVSATGLTEKYEMAAYNLKVAEAEEAARLRNEPSSSVARTANTKVDFGQIDLSTINPGLTVAPLTFKLDLLGSTQFSTPFTVNDLKQNGLPVGNLTGVDVDKTGVMYAKYSNGFAKPLGQVALARFPDNQSLAKVGNTTWLSTSESGAPIYGAGGDNNFGTIQSSAIENSNVDLSEQLVKLIVAQQAYQANSQTVTTEKTLIETMLRI